MRKIVIPLFALLAAMLAPSSCRLAPKDAPGDTVAASEFYPPDTAALRRKAPAKAKADSARDSADLFFVGSGSTARRLQLVSYPSRRDTALYAKGRHVKVAGNAGAGHVVRVRLWVSDRGDTLVQRVEEVRR